MDFEEIPLVSPDRKQGRDFFKELNELIAKGAFSVGVEIGRSSRKECPRAVCVTVP